MPYHITYDIVAMGIYFKIDPETLKSASKERPVTEARRVLCYIAVRKLGYKCTEVSKALDISSVTVSKAVSLGKELPEVDNIHKQMQLISGKQTL